MNLGNRSLAEIQDYIATQRALIASAEQARSNLRMAMSYIAEMSEVSRVLTCEDLIEEGRWLASMCCSDCHASGGLYSATLENGQRAELCHNAAILLSPAGMPSHAEECN